MDQFLENLEHIILHYWYWILFAIFIYWLWAHDLIVLLGKEVVLPLFGVIIVGRLAWTLWLHYVQQDFISGIDFVLLEIVPPRDVLRSPKAMELFLVNALYHWSEKGGKEEWWQGAVWFWFSLEIASIDGQVHFYIRTPTRVRGLIETQMYAQYPQAQVKAVEDYTLAVDAITPESAWMGWGCEFKLVKPEAFPIKTYIDFGLDKDPKEEYKVDPISSVVELFGSLKKGEQMWSQIVITPAKKMWHTEGTWFGKHDWVEESKHAIMKLLEPYARQNKKLDVEGTFNKEFRTPDFLKNAVTGMSAKTSKLGFETGVRIMYIAKKEVYDMSSRRNIRLIWRQYSKPDSNEFFRVNSTQADAFGSQFFSLNQKQVMTLADRMLLEYRERSFFHLPLRHVINPHNLPWPTMLIVKQFFLPYFHPPTYVLNVEELATLWHFPGQILKVPTLERIESKEASPPTNLPI